MADWKGGLVQFPRAFLGQPSRINIPAEFADEATLLAYLGMTAAELKKIWYYRAQMYRIFSIGQSPGKVRIINAPDKRLAFMQRQLAHKLAELYRLRNPVHGFAPKRSIKTNALVHLNRRFIVNVDISDFFDSISQNRIKGLLLSLGIDAKVSKIIAQLCCNNSCLPQGAPSSPVLSNMICFRLDKELLEFAKGARCLYSRYADDITFSSHQLPTALFETGVPPTGNFEPSHLKADLSQIFRNNGFTLNPKKAHYADLHSRRVVTGIKINESLNVDRRYVRNIRATLYAISILGIAEAEKKYHEKYRGRGSLAAHLQGEISFLAHIKGRSDPVARGITLRFNECFPTHQIMLMPTQAEIRDRAVWLVEHDEFQGTAFFLKGVGLVTAAHCVTNVSEVEVLHPEKRANRFKATIRRRDEHRDLAILDHQIPATEYLELESASRAIERGDRTTAVGYPEWAPGDQLNIRSGSVTSLTVKSAVRKIEVEQKLSQGMSGGPLLDIDCAVVGIIHQGGPSEGRDFAVHIDMLKEWFKKD